MTSIEEILREADPLRNEQEPSDAERDRVRRSVVAAASEVSRATAGWFRAPLAVLAVVAVILVGIVAVGSRSGARGSATVYAAVRFEVRLAEDLPASGLREVRVSGASRSIYLHDEAVVTNADIEGSSVVATDNPSRFNIGVRFNPAGAEKMRRATTAHVGRPIAILIDGEVVMAPVIRDPIDGAALITGDYTRAEAERIVNGIGVR